MEEAEEAEKTEESQKTEESHAVTDLFVEAIFYAETLGTFSTVWIDNNYYSTGAGKTTSS